MGFKSAFKGLNKESVQKRDATGLKLIGETINIYRISTGETAGRQLKAWEDGIKTSCDGVLLTEGCAERFTAT